MNDDLGLFADDPAEPLERPSDPEQFRRRKRRRMVTAVAGIFVLLLVGGGVLYGASQLMGIGSYEDYDGPGTGEVVIEVESGDTVSAIGSTLAEKDVVASAKAFVEAAKNHPGINGIQPGFYLMRAQMSGAAAVERIMSPEAKVGRVEVRGGMRLEDQLAPDGKTTPGVLTRLAEATCVGTNGDCTTSEEMHRVAETADLAALGVPEWALEEASQAEPHRRLEGLIMPGVYDVRPGESVERFREVITSSAAVMEVPTAAGGGGDRYCRTKSSSSLPGAERRHRGLRISRVIYNRLEPPACSSAWTRRSTIRWTSRAC